MARPEGRKMILPDSAVEQTAKKRDPNLLLIAAQIVICALIVLLAYIAADVRPELLEDIRQPYLELIATRSSDLKIEDLLPPMLKEKAAEAKEAANAVIIEFMDDEEQPPEEVSDAQPLEGAGGLFSPKDVVESSGLTAPSGCTFAPIITSAPLQTPLSGRVTSLYGYREHPISGAEDFHRGVDIAALEGSKIHVVLPGEVAEIGSSQIYGNYIVIDHGGGLLTTYSHCSEILAPQGAVLRAGETVASVGSTGISTGPHVHFEVSKNGEYYDPAWLLEGF